MRGVALALTLAALSGEAGVAQATAETTVEAAAETAAKAGGGAAQGPLSAIPWLSDSLREVRPAPRPKTEAPAPTGDGEITVTTLAPVRRDAVGLLPPEATGLPRALWGPAPAARVRDLIRGHADLGVPASRALFRRLLLAEADPPGAEAGEDGRGVLLARLDRLLDLGALEEAEALILAAGPETPELFVRWFDIGLLTQRAQPQCAALRLNPALSPTLPARVFCLARGGDWNAAEITLTLGQDVGEIGEDQEALLARFLDPVPYEEDPPPPIPQPLTALDFTLREAVGLPRPSGALPLAFLQADLDPHAPMRARVTAAERLVLAGSLAPPALFTAYVAGEPAASGGFWDRAQAVQDLDAALDAGAAEAIVPALEAADLALSEGGFRVAFAVNYAPSFAGLVTGPASGPDAAIPLPEATRARLAELLLLAGETEAATRAAGAAPGPRLEALLAIARGAPAAEIPPEALSDARLAAVAEGLRARDTRDDTEARARAQLAEGRTGEVVLEALTLLGAGPGIDPAPLRAALHALSAAGQGAAARAIGLQTLLTPA